METIGEKHQRKVECNSRFYTVVTCNSVQYSINAIISNQPYRYFGYYKTVHSMYKSGRSFRNVLVHNHFIFACCLITRFSTRTTIPSLVQLIFPSLLIYLQNYDRISTRALFRYHGWNHLTTVASSAKNSTGNANCSSKVPLVCIAAGCSPETNWRNLFQNTIESVLRATT